MIGIFAVVMLFGGLIAGMIAYSKTPTNGTFVAFFILGALFPLIGIIVAALTKPAAPAGLLAVVCPRCTAKQNIEQGATEWSCWQCHTGWHLPTRTA
jgi:hypothetical protein